MQRILILGATSAIAEACARRFVARGDALFLAGRNAGKLAAIVEDLGIRRQSRSFPAGNEPPPIGSYCLDARDLAEHSPLLAAAQAHMGGLDVVLLAHGSLPDQAACEASPEQAVLEISTNGVSVVYFLTLVAQHMEAQGHGTLAVISSVAGDRGRQSNYVYGCAKAMVSTFLSGLGQRLNKQGIRVVDIRPGFVDTPMTANFPKGILWAKPDNVAKGIITAMDRGQAVAYVPAFWWLIMTIVRHIPEKIFRRLHM